MSATTLPSGTVPPKRAFRVGLLAQAERTIMGLQLVLALLATGLLIVSTGWRLLAPDGAAIAEIACGLAALLVAVPVLASAWQSLVRPSLHGMTDLLIGLAVVAAWASGDLVTAALLPIVMVVAHVLEERSLLGSRDAIRALGRLTQTTARRRLPDGSEAVVPTASLRTGDHVVLRAGDRVPCDGVVLSGAASMDVSSLTGESVPVDVGPGATVLAGSIDTNGALEVRAISTGAETTLGKIVSLLRDAERAKPPVTRLLETYAAEYLGLVLMIAAGTWLASGDMEATLAVLVAACPCALVLAAPATSIAAIAVAARHGILIKSAAFLENLAEVTSVVFDKTGTLTTGTLRLVHIVPAGGVAPETVLAVAGALGSASSHPVSRAAAAAAGSVVPAADAKEMGGFGMLGRLRTEAVAFGRPDLFGDLGVPVSPIPEHDGPIAGVSRGGTFLGWLLFADQPRPEAGAALAELRAIGLTRQALLTGDRAPVARQVAAALGIDTVIAEALPADKMRHVLAEVAAGQRPMVVGDGINDSLALKVGAVGVAMGAQGTDVALAAADLVLMTSDLRRLGTALRLSRRCRRTIHWNVALALGWTLVLIGLAASGALGAAGAIVAAVLHNVSTFLGMANAGRLLLFNESGAPVDQRR
ncbi:MAG: cation-translocating P-type ATPase [Acetobacteraceae bacterium]